MTPSTQPVSLIEEINLRQDQVLADLDELNHRIEAVLSQFVSRPDDQMTNAKSR